MDPLLTMLRAIIPFPPGSIAAGGQQEEEDVAKAMPPRSLCGDSLREEEDAAGEATADDGDRGEEHEVVS